MNSQHKIHEYIFNKKNSTPSSKINDPPKIGGAEELIDKNPILPENSVKNIENNPWLKTIDIINIQFMGFK